MTVSFFAAAVAIVRKDIRAELRSRELVSTMGLFALLAVLIFSFALELDRIARVESISGVLWVTLVFASILGLNRSMGMERDGGNLDGLLLAPVPRAALYTGKLLGNLLFIGVVAIVLLPLMTVLYNVPVFSPVLIGVVALGAFGFAVVGTLLAAMTAQTRARESLLPILMLPVALPLLLAAVRATTGILNAAPINSWASWIGILAALDLIFTVLCLSLFGFVVED